MRLKKAITVYRDNISKSMAGELDVISGTCNQLEWEFLKLLDYK